MAKNLTARQLEFCRQYIANPIGVEAYVAAFGRGKYSEKSLANQATKLLCNPKITRSLAEMRQQAGARTDITVDRVMREYGRLAFFDPRKLFDSQGSMLRVVDMDDDTRAAISSIEVDETGERCRTVKIKLWDKRAALGDLAKILGMNKEAIPAANTGTILQLVVLPSGQTPPNPQQVGPAIGVRMLPAGSD